jgi:hypothetical protein
MGFFWFLLGGGIFAWQWTHPDRKDFTIWNTGISSGWIALVLGFYCLLIWWVNRANQKRIQAIHTAEKKLRSDFQKRTESKLEEPNPDFDFSGGKPPPENPPES